MAIWGSDDSPGELLMLRDGAKLTPLFVLLTNIISLPPALSSSHATYTLPPETATFGLVESAVALLRFLALVKVAPLSELLANIICPLPVLLVSSHSRYTLLPDTASLGLRESPAV